MDSMNHQGHPARIQYNEREDIFVGRILGIRSITSFHGRAVKELRKEFEHAVDDCLAECSEKGVSPEKPAPGKLLLRVTPAKAWAASCRAAKCGHSEVPRG